METWEWIVLGVTIALSLGLLTTLVRIRAGRTDEMASAQDYLERRT